MKQLREGYTTGSCAAAASFASVLWQTSGKCPEWVELEVPAGKLLHLEIQAEEAYTCGVQKDGGDDPDETNGCLRRLLWRFFPLPEPCSFVPELVWGRSPEKG